MRLIDVDALKKPLEVAVKESGFYRPMYQSFLKALENAPTIDAEPVKHGHWIEYEDNKRECYCSECDFPAGLDDYGYHNMQDPYCRFCGAKMDEVSE